MARLIFAVLLLGVIFIVWYVYPRKQVPPGTERFYTDDDGTTWFADDARKVPPFLHSGKETVLAKVYQTDKGKAFVAYLEKYTEESKAKIEGSTAAQPSKAGAHTARATGILTGLLVKKPHTGVWVPDEDPAASDIKNVTAPDGSTDFMPLTPE